MVRLSKEIQIEPTAHNLELSEAFGITGARTFTLFDIEIPNQWEILYITGESGSGKTSIANDMGLMNYRSESFNADTPLAETYSDLGTTLYRLSSVGLGDAANFLATYSELSDSQQARFRLMLELFSGKEIIMVDEFLSTLDRETAKAVAYSTQKAIRREGKRAILVTAHNDLEEYLQPNVVVEGMAYPSEFTVRKIAGVAGNPYDDKITYRYGTKEEYRELRLGELHYKGKYTGGTKEFLFAERNGRAIGVLVSTNVVGKGEYERKIARLVVHPSYRGTGVGAELVRRFVADFPLTRVVSGMGRYSKVFEKAGMVFAGHYEQKPVRALTKQLQALGFDVTRWADLEYCREWAGLDEFRAIVSPMLVKDALRLVQPGGKKLTGAEVQLVLEGDVQTFGRVLREMRPKKLARYKSIELEGV